MFMAARAVLVRSDVQILETTVGDCMPMHPSLGPSRSQRFRRAARIWKNERTAGWLFQCIFLGAAIFVVGFFISNMLRELDGLGLGIRFGFLRHEAGFGISEGIAYDPRDSYARALWAGAVNTLRVVGAGIVCATFIGVVVGIARLSSNWLVRNLALAYVETFRNIPLLLQLSFWYSAVLLKLPPVRQSVSVFDAVFINQRGLYLPRLVPLEAYATWRIFLLVGLIGAVAAYVHGRMLLRRHDRPGFPLGRAILVFLLVAAVGWIAAGGSPVAWEAPELQRFNFSGGIQLSPEFAGLLLGLSIYTGAFIAEVVRGGVQAVDKGQWDAAAALGLSSLQAIRLVVLPQALRTIVPPLTSQYLNLAKNSSLAVAIGYPELFNIGTTMMNQTGQTIPVMMIIIGSYLALSLIASAFMNWYNRVIRF